MKKMFYLLFSLATCMFLLSGCGFFDGFATTEATTESKIEEDQTEDLSTQDTADEIDEIDVANPEDNTETEADTEDDSSNQTTAADNPRDNVAADASKEYTATGKYCGFIDSNSVEIELSDGSYCSFFAFDEDVRSALSKLDEENMPEITFTYKARDGQRNPEIISVIGG